eukprot:c18866_g1_i1.p1 GENE.c18866_g1_i1~~c18866_g1_i1.p1  ORF type:complete len:328 (+),score=27.85 c18866_g1_i1:654-1637(+)
MVVAPSPDLFKYIIGLLNTTVPYNGGEQGITNAAFPHLQSMPLWDPEAPHRSVRRLQPHDHFRLPPSYNINTGMFYYQYGSWEGLFEGEPQAFHFTLGGLKPWNWYEYCTFPLHWIWYRHLRANPEYPLITILRVTTPALLLSSGYRIFSVIGISWMKNPVVRQCAKRLRSLICVWPVEYAYASTLLCFVPTGLAFRLAVAMTPGIPQLHPLLSHVVCGSWVTALIGLLFAVHLSVHVWVGMLAVPDAQCVPLSFRDLFVILRPLRSKFRIALASLSLGMLALFAFALAPNLLFLLLAGLSFCIMVVFLTFVLFQVPFVAIRRVHAH